MYRGHSIMFASNKFVSNMHQMATLAMCTRNESGGGDTVR